jgi:hypothetical protein
VGPLYDTPGYGIRLIYEGLDKYIKHTARFIVLCGPLILFSALAVFTILKRRPLDWRVWPALMFVVSFTFPFVFGFANVDVWDNIHKFAVTTMYVGPILVAAFFRDTLFSPKKVTWYLLLCILLSLPALSDIVAVRLSTDYTHQIYPVERIADIATYLKGAHKTIVPYKMDAYEICEADQYAGIADHSGNYMKDSYYVNFLLADDLEQTYKQELQWTNATATIAKKIADIDGHTVMVVRRAHETEFLQILHDTSPQTLGRVRYFKNFLLYE